jgi:Tol biopolymer transport system component
VSPDGKWLACPNETDGDHAHDELQVTSLKPGEWFPTHIVRLGIQGDIFSPTWSPDGRLLAVIHGESYLSSNCSISIFSGVSPYEELTHRAELSSSEFDTALCSFDSLTWSPDGDWLAIAAHGVKLIPIRDILLGLLDETNPPSSYDVPKNFLLSLTDPQDDSSFAPAWNSQTHLITYLTDPHSDDQGKVLEPQRILTYDPVSQQRTVLLTLPLIADEPSSSLRYHQHVSALAWDPNGQQVLFVVDKDVKCVDCGVTYPSQVYTFTPAPISA